MDELQHIIEQKQELLARESISRPALDYSEGMTAEEQKRYINYLEYEERLSKLDVVLSDVEDLKKCLSSEVKRRKAAERKAADLEAKLKFANKNRFGDKSHRSKKKSPEEESDRTQDKDDFDGTSSSLPENSMANKGSDASAAAPASQEKKPRDLSNRPDTYKTMGVQGASKEYKSDMGRMSLTACFIVGLPIWA